MVTEATPVALTPANDHRFIDGNPNTYTSLRAYSNGSLRIGDRVVGYTTAGQKITGKLEGLRGSGIGGRWAAVAGYAVDWRSVRFHG